MNKTELKKWVKENCLNSGFTQSLLSKIDQLDEPTPALLPFQWPVPENMQVVTRDGREVTQLVKFECTSPYPFNGIITGEDNYVANWEVHGKFYEGKENKGDLFLREKSPEMVDAWYLEKAGYAPAILLDKFSVAYYQSLGYNAYPVQFPKPTKSDI